MKNQASLSLVIVAEPINSKAAAGTLLLRATPTGLKVFDENGTMNEVVPVASTTSAGVVKVDGSTITIQDGVISANPQTATVDLSNYSGSTIKLTGTTKIELNAGTGTALQIATESGDNNRTTLKTSGLWSADVAGYLTTIHGGMKMDIYADSNQADVRVYAGGNPSSGSGNGDILLYGNDVKFNGTSLLNQGGGADLTAYVGSVSLKNQPESSGQEAAISMTNSGVISMTGYNVQIGATTGGVTGQMSEFGVTAAVINLHAEEGIRYNDSFMNQPGGLVSLDSSGRLPAVDGSLLTNLPAATVDLSNYSTTSAISLKSNGNGTGIVMSTVNGEIAIYTGTVSNGMRINGAATTITGGTVTLTGSLSTVIGSSGGAGTTTICAPSLTALKLQIGSGASGAGANTAGGLVVIGSDGKIPSSLIPEATGGTVDLSAYTGGINLNSTNDSAVSIKFNSGNPSYNASFTMGVTGVEISGYGDVKLAHTGGAALTLSSGTTSLSSSGTLSLSATSRIVLTASEGIYLGAAGQNTAGGIAVVDSETGKLPQNIIPTATATAKRAYIPIPEGDNGVSIQELFVELKFSKTGDFTDSVDVTMLNAAAAMSGITTVVQDNGDALPEAVAMTNAGVPPEFFGTVLVLNITQLGPSGLNLLESADGYVATYRWRSTYDDNTTNSPWRVLSL